MRCFSSEKTLPEALPSAVVTRFIGTMASPTPLLSFHLSRCLDLSGDTLIMENSKGLPRSLQIPSKHATLSDPDGAAFGHPIVTIGDVAFRPFANVGPHTKQDFGAQSLQLTLAAYFSCCLRLTHVVTSASPKLAPGCTGPCFPVRTFTSDMLGASWRTKGFCFHFHFRLQFFGPCIEAVVTC